MIFVTHLKNMGLSSSELAHTTKKPWREPSKWDSTLEQKLLEEIKQTKPDVNLNLIVIGPVGSGKSSFINAVLSVAEGRKVSKAQAGYSASSYTLRYTAHTQKTLLKNFIFRDTSGIELVVQSGLHVDDFIYLVKGNIQNLYEFNPAQPISPKDDKFRANPEPTDVTHCVIFVISAVDVYNEMPEAYIKKIKKLQTKLQAERVPRVLILTMADRLCEMVHKDVCNMFWSRKVQTAVKRASDIFQIEQASIHPVVNYETSYTLTPEQNVPLLLALKQNIQFAHDRFQQMQDDRSIS